MQSDKRRAARLEIAKDVFLGSGSQELKAKTGDISNFGVWICTAETLPLGAEVSVTINDDLNGKIITASGNVLRTSEGVGMAVAFSRTPVGIDNFIAAAA